MSSFRIGFGYDVHRLEEGESLVLGGVSIPHQKGLLGHSDADVLAHAITDAILGAAGLNDIGTHFPDTDLQYKNANSLLLLKEAYQIVQKKGFLIGNIDSTITAQAPKLKPFISEMKNNIASTLRISPNQVNIKATTTEYLGFVGRKEGMEAYAVALIYQT
jgi:2-C-methyl-D-erythritol 2,4-cyclodiphosphate synthase